MSEELKVTVSGTNRRNFTIEVGDWTFEPYTDTQESVDNAIAAWTAYKNWRESSGFEESANYQYMLALRSDIQAWVKNWDNGRGVDLTGKNMVDLLSQYLFYRGYGKRSPYANK